MTYKLVETSKVVAIIYQLSNVSLYIFSSIWKTHPINARRGCIFHRYLIAGKFKDEIDGEKWNCPRPLFKNFFLTFRQKKTISSFCILIREHTPQKPLNVF